MQKNVAGQKWVVFAFNETTNVAQTGDAANITANLRIDGAAANAIDDVNPTELEDGYYVFDLTQVETNGNLILICPASSTANIQVIGVPGAVWTRPPNFPAMGIAADGDLTKVNTLDGHTAQTGDSFARIGAPAAASIAADLVVIDNFVDELESRLSAVRAGYIDNLSAGAVAQAGTALSTVTWTAARAAVLSDWINDGRLDLILDIIAADVVGLNGEAMRGTDSANTVVPDAAGTAATPAEVAQALSDIHLDHLLAVDYDPASKPGVATALLNELVENDAGISRFTENALEQAPSGSGGDATEANQTSILSKLLAYFQLALRSDAAITTDNATELTAINADEGSGGGDYGNQTESQEAILDTGNIGWISGDGLSGSNARTINIKDQNTNNVVECAVEIWDSANTTFYERKTTDASGNTTHNMDNGTYTVRIHKAGYTFTDKTLVVSGAGTTDYTGSTVIIGTPAAADACRVYEYCMQQDGITPMTNVKGTAQIDTLPYDYSDSLHAGSIIDGTYNSSTGLLYWDLVRIASVKFLISSLGIDSIESIPDSETARLTDL